MDLIQLLSETITMKKTVALIVACHFLAVFCSLLVGCGESKPVPPPQNKQWVLPIASLKVGAPQEYISAGSVVSNRRVSVASRLIGHIREVRVQAGDQVRANQVMALLDAADVENGIKQAEAQVSAAESALRDTSTDLERFRSLYAKGYVSEMDARKLKLRFDSEQEALNQARAALVGAKSQRDYTDIRSPIDGFVVERLREAGDLATPGEPILAIESGDDLVFQTYVTEQEVAQIQPGMAVTLAFDGLNKEVSSTVHRVIRSADAVTRSYPVRLSLPASEGLKPGMFGRAKFLLGELKVPVVPVSALVERGGLKGVFVVKPDGVASFRWLRLGREWSTLVEVTAGLEAGEQFVSVSERGLRDGDRVLEKEPTP